MSRILVAWELGGNYGHLARQRPVADALRAAGHEVLFAVCDTRVAAQVLAPRAFAYVQAPMLGRAGRLRRPPATYAELLLAEGYGDADSLHGAVGAWLRLFQMWRPHALIVDHSPTVLLAARIAALPAVQIGHGFEIPPGTSPLPVIRNWESIDPGRVERSEARVLDTVNGVLRRVRNEQRLTSLAELYTWSDQVLVTFRELDQFPQRMQGTYAGPLFSEVGNAAAIDDVDADIASDGSDRPQIFAYLHNGAPGLRALIEALAASRARTTCVIPELGAAACRQLSTQSLTVSAAPRDLRRVLPSADLVICSGIGVVSQTLLAAAPLMLVPSTVEEYLVAQRVKEIGAGLLVGADRRKAAFDGAIEELLTEQAFRVAARGFAERYKGFDSRAVVAQAVDTVTRALRAA